MEKKGSGNFLRSLAILAVLVFIGLAAYLLLRGGGAPKLSLSPDGDAASYTTEFTLKLAAGNGGLASVNVSATQDGRRVEMVSRSFGSGMREHTEVFRIPREAGFKEGPCELVVTAKAHSLLAFLGRGKASLTRKLTLDLVPPRLTVPQGIHNINQGGAGAVSFTVSKPVERAGVAVGESFFPAFQQKNGEWICFFAMPYDMPTSSFRPKVIARDRAGNEAAVPLSVLAIPKVFKSDKLNVPDEFLNDKMTQYTELYPDLKEPVEIYKRVNSELRTKNVAELLKIGQQTAPTQLWSGPFLRLPNAAGRAGFGDQRDYFYKGEKIDHQTHMGVDLASVAGAPVPAANSGVVVFAQFFGIYGNCIIIDHGLGVQSLYSHLSQIGVQKGQAVKRGEIIGNTGATGLAGGDHLHFGILISGIQMNPVEWWDEHWIRDNIVKHIGAPSPAPAAQAAPAAKQ
jgi:murein DD-endopeptidase MepM/ murein hydrolase activator NlpD